MQFQNQQKSVNASIVRCIEYHSSQAQTKSQSMQRVKVGDASRANEDHL